MSEQLPDLYDDEPPSTEQLAAEAIIAMRRVVEFGDVIRAEKRAIEACSELLERYAGLPESR